MDIKQFMPKISESDLRNEVRKEYANVAIAMILAIITNYYLYFAILFMQP